MKGKKLWCRGCILGISKILEISKSIFLYKINKLNDFRLVFIGLDTFLKKGGYGKISNAIIKIGNFIFKLYF